MVNICSVPLCESVKGKTKGVSFHEFPSRMEFREQWLNNIKRVSKRGSLKPWTPEDRSCVCSLHFDESAYLFGSKVRKLKKFAVPTIFNDFPDHLKSGHQSSVRKRRPPTTREEPQKKLKPTQFEMDEDFDHREDNPIRCSVAQRNICDGNADVVVKQCPEQSKRPIFKKSSLWGNTMSPTKTKRKMKSNSMQISRLKATVEKLRKENSELKKDNTDNLLHIAIRVKKDRDNGVTRAAILFEQLASYGKKWQNWSEKMIRSCILWRSKSPRAYEYVRKEGLLKLPCNSTLKRFLGPTSMDLGLSDLIRTRLTEHLKSLTPVETYTSLIFDEMAIKPKLIHMRRKGRLFGEVNFAGWLNSKRGTLANRLLCFVLKGLSTSYNIPVAYFLVRCLTGDQLLILIKRLVTELELLGFRIVRLVADDLSVNQRVFRELSGGQEIKPMIPHIVKPNRPLFLSFDYCHVIKNIRNNLLSRKLEIHGKKINKDLILKLYESEKGSSLKLARLLTRKMVYPSTFEKMNVDRAVRLFSIEVTAAIEFMYSGENSDDVESTIKFMGIMRKWFEVHDVSNAKHHILSKNGNKAPFLNRDDARLTWLEKDFLRYLDDWRSSIPVLISKTKVNRKPTGKPRNALPNAAAEKKEKPTPYLTKATDTAIRITTQSTVLCIRYLLDMGFEFVLSRKFSSDAIESMFGGIRQMGGCNDQCDAVSAICSLEKILKTGLLSPSTDSNVGMSRLSNIFGSRTSTVQPNVDPALSDAEDDMDNPEYSNFLAISANILETPPEIDKINAKVASASVISAFICRNVRDKFFCKDGSESLVNSSKDSQLYEFIRLQDNGGLMYPSEGLVRLVMCIFDLLDKFLYTFREWKNCNTNLVDILKPATMRSGILQCGCDDTGHSDKLSTHILKQVIKIYLQNIANMETNKEDFKSPIQMKPSCRKVLKLS